MLHEISCRVAGKISISSGGILMHAEGNGAVDIQGCIEDR
jgi:hypothetical protein